jgi:hypothetical protein
LQKPQHFSAVKVRCGTTWRINPNRPVRRAIDDENCWTWSFDYRAKSPLESELVQQMREGAGIYTVVDPRTNFFPAPA